MMEEVIPRAESVPMITQTTFFSPAFNAAIFDAPIRLYFAQYQEEEALKIYFRLQDYLKGEGELLKMKHKKRNTNIFIMLYPNTDLFSRSFSQHEEGEIYGFDRIDDDLIIGVNGSEEDVDIDPIVELIESASTIDC